MKKPLTLAAVLIMLLIDLTASAQCTINTGNTSPGLTPNNLPCITSNVSYGQAQQIYVPASAQGGLTIDSAVFTGITGLPAGISYTINPANGRFLGGSTGCVWFSGTTMASSGTYPLTLSGTIYTSVGPVPVSQFIQDTVSICSASGCTINNNDTFPGLYPANLPCITANVSYGQSQQIYVPASAASGAITVDSAVFTGITGLPAGINYTITPANGFFSGGSHGCIWFSGTTTVTSGTFPLTIGGTIYTNAGPYPVSQFISDTVSICGVRPTASFTASPDTVCVNAPVTFTSTSTGSPTSYSWTFAGGNPYNSNQQTPPTVTYSNPGSYAVTLVVSNSGGSDTLIMNNYITVSAMPAVTVTTTPSTCGNSTGTATAIVTGGSGSFTYAWSPSGTTSTLSNLPAGLYTVTVSSQGCMATASNSVNNSNGPSITFTNTEPLCYFSTDGKIIAGVTGGTSPYTYAWAGQASTTDSLTGIGSATYVLTVTDNSGCQAIAADSLGQPIYVSDNISTTNCNGTADGTAWGNPMGGTPPYTYLWSPGGATTDTITGLTPGTYSLTVTDAHGCTDPASGVVGGTVGINEVPQIITAVTVAPNPSNEELTVTADLSASSAAVELKLYDMEGKNVYSYAETTGSSKLSKKINVAGYTAGIYILEVRANGESHRISIAVAH